MSAPSGNIQDILNQCKQILQQNPTNTDSLQDIIVPTLRSAYNDGFNILKELLRINPKVMLDFIDELFIAPNKEFTLSLDLYNNSYQFELAIENFLTDMLKTEYPDNFQNTVNDIRVNLAWAQTSGDHNLETAYSNFEKVNKQDASNTLAIYGLAYCKTWLYSDYKEADKLFSQYIKLMKPEQVNVNAWWHWGYCSIQLNHYDDAKNSFQKYIDNTGDDDKSIFQYRIDALNYLGYAAAQVNNLDLADRTFNRVLDKDSRNFGATLGKTQVVQKRNFIDAKKDLIKNAQDNLKGLFEKVPSGLNTVARMYIIQFSIGVFFILLAIVLAALGINTLISGIAGFAGGAITIVSLINKAPIDLQRTRVNTAQWMIAYYNWINALYIVSAATDQITKNHKEMNWEKTSPMQDYLTKLTADTIRTMKEYCVIPDKSTDKKDSNVKSHANNPPPAPAK